MPSCGYKKLFLRDLAAIPKRDRSRIEKLVFELVPGSPNPFHDFDLVKMTGYPDYYRIRIGKYRIGCRISPEGEIIFYRVKSREEIYRVFP